MPSVDEAEVRQLAALAHLALSDEEIRAAAGHLDRLLGYVARLQAIAVDDASETIHVGDRTTPLREDRVRPSLPREVVTAAAPSAPAGLFEVPKVLAGAPAAPGAGDDDEASR